MGALAAVGVAPNLNSPKADAALPEITSENPLWSPLVPVYIGVGSNLADPQTQVRQAIDALSRLTDRDFMASSLYCSPPMGPSDQPDYINAVVYLETKLQPLELLQRLQAVEQQQGRVRTERWGARTLDLDLLLYSDLTLDSDILTIPHPGIAERDFVLVPLNEIAPDLAIPELGPVAYLCETCPTHGVTKHVD